MKFWTALAGGFIAAELCLNAVFSIGLAGTPTEPLGKAYVTQASVAASVSQDYDITFGDNWESVRTFRLLKPLDKPLKVFIETHPRKRELYKSQYRDYAVESLKSWSEALDGRLSFVETTKRRDADITLDWVPAFDDRYVAGVTNYSVGHASVEIKTVGVPEKDIKCNILHEMGHALGISGHSNNQNDIMVGMRRWHRDNTPYEPRLSRRDVQAIRRLYSANWKKGEDLYAASAQQAPISAPDASTAHARSGKQNGESAVSLQPFDDTAISRANQDEGNQSAQTTRQSSSKH